MNYVMLHFPGNYSVKFTQFFFNKLYSQTEVACEYILPFNYLSSTKRTPHFKDLPYVSMRTFVSNISELA